MKGILNKDCWLLGLAIGIALPLIAYLLLNIIDNLIESTFGMNITREHHLLYLLSVIVNMWPIRHYLVKSKYEKTGFGVIISTAILVLTYFYLYYPSQS